MVSKHEQVTRSLSLAIAAKGKERRSKQAKHYNKRIEADARKKRQRQEWQEYKDHVRQLTEWQQLHQVPGIELRGKDWALDHCASIWWCFHNSIPPHQAAHHSNLQMLPTMENLRKGRASWCALNARSLPTATA